MANEREGMTQRDDTENRMMDPADTRGGADHVEAQATGAMDAPRNPAFDGERTEDSGMTYPGQYGTGGDDEGISPATGGGAGETRQAGADAQRIGDRSVDERDERGVMHTDR
jgi:hypothetical protein